METITNIKTADKVLAFIRDGYKKKALSEKLGITRQTFDTRLKDNAWKDNELATLRRLGII